MATNVNGSGGRDSPARVKAGARKRITSEASRCLARFGLEGRGPPSPKFLNGIGLAGARPSRVCFWFIGLGYFNSNPTGQWSLPITSGLIHARFSAGRNFSLATK
jgi:hypothetical protein